MSEAANEAESDRLHRQVGWILRGGLSVSVLFLLGGMIAHIAGGRDDAPAARPWQLGGDAGLILSTVGVLVLALTPALRVLAVLVIWWRERDWRFVGVALAVVATLAVGMALGKG